jgi:cyclase
MTTRLLLFAGTIAAACVSVSSAGEQDPRDPFAGVELTAVPVAGQVHMVTRPGGGGNVGVFAGLDGVLLVDALFATLAERLVSAVWAVSAETFRFLINTHVHPDHIGANAHLAGQGVLIFAHDNVRVRALEQLRFPRRGRSLPTTTR